MGKTGVDCMLNKELLERFKEQFIKGKDIRNSSIAVFNDLEQFNKFKGEEREKELNNFIQKVYNWKYRNELNIATLIETWKLDHQLRLATNNIKGFLKMSTSSKKILSDGETIIEIEDPALVRVKADMSKFVAETIGKSNYSKRTELTGANGKDLIVGEEKKLLADKAINDFINDDSGDTK